MTAHGLRLDPADLREFCDRWKIRRLSVYGSILRADFRPDSDVDFLAEFADDEDWDAFDEVHMRQELERIVGPRVDLADRRAVEADCNPYRRASIVSTAEVVCAH